MNYRIINTGSDGNATVIEDAILLDCGVSYKRLSDYVKDLKLVFISHCHTDHLNKRTVKLLARERPTLRFAVGEYLVQNLIDCGVDRRNIDIVEPNKIYDYSLFKIETFKLHHDVPNQGIKVYIDNFKIIYATDTCSLEDVSAIDFDYYFIEANYENEEELHNRAYNSIYEERVKSTHLSKEYATEWLLKNMGSNSYYKFMHGHKEHNAKEVDRIE